jgi:hypothetical protein
VDGPVIPQVSAMKVVGTDPLRNGAGGRVH